MAPLRHKHIAAGCLYISGKEHGALTPDDWELSSLREWNCLIRKSDGYVPHENETTMRCMDPDLQARLLKGTNLAHCARLFRASWILLEFKIDAKDSSSGILRVYLLPDDIDRGTVDRANSALKKSRLQLIQDLDFSRDSWNLGEQISIPQTLESFSARDEDTAPSLLQLFNGIAAPNPDLDEAPDQYSHNAMYDLLESRIPGLTTTLYPYQRRSAALMCQKEVNPATFLDPRLLKMSDNTTTEEWYLDPVSGNPFREGRSYDGVSGGILAEEMGLGKTIICLALILTTRHLPTQGPDIYGVAGPGKRPKVASLADMAASSATRHGVPWKPYLKAFSNKTGDDVTLYNAVLDRNPGFYLIPPEERRVLCRRPPHPDTPVELPRKVYLSNGSLVIVPNNLVTQWRQEINKHTEGLRVLSMTLSKHNTSLLPDVEDLVKYDIVLFSQGRFEKVGREPGGYESSPLTHVHFKRCIVDEGHKLGNSRMGKKSVLLMGLDMMRFNARWIVTGTPSHGLYGVEGSIAELSRGLEDSRPTMPENGTSSQKSSAEMERKDLDRIGAIAALYLKARPWANTVLETGDTVAEWSKYVMLPKHDPKSCGNWDSLRSTLSSLIIRHPRADIGDLLPPVHERRVVLEGSFQDRLSMNLFSMMIVFNAVQSERTDLDYFFHPKQRQHVLQIVSNMKQSSFFGSSFFSRSDILTSVRTAEKFLEEQKVPISEEDKTLLRDAIQLGHFAAENSLRIHSNQFHEMPLAVEDFPGRAGPSWSLSGSGDPDETTVTSASLILTLQKLIFDTAGSPEALNSLLNGSLVQEGMLERQRLLMGQARQSDGEPVRSEILAGNTRLGNDSPHKSRSHGINGVKAKKAIDPDAFKGPLERTKITATVSAKLSYLIDSILEHQEEDKIIVFYENENVAFYLSATLDVVSVFNLRQRKRRLTHVATNPASHLCEGSLHGEEGTICHHISQ